MRLIRCHWSPPKQRSCLRLPPIPCFAFPEPSHSATLMATVGLRVREKGESKRDRDDIIKDYEKKLAEAGRTAYVVAGLQSVTRFLGLCSLTWATVVL
eukprot:c14329_g1_i1 orf=102-395(+)